MGVRGLPLDLGELPEDVEKRLFEIREPLQKALEAAVSFKLNAGKKVGNYNLAQCRSVTDRADEVLIRAMGLDVAREDLELLYMQMVRTDFEGDQE